MNAGWLLDTHAFIWLLTTPERLPQSLVGQLRNTDRTVLLSVASLWEIAIKMRLGKLAVDEDDPESYLPDQLRRRSITPVVIEPAHALRVASLPDLHRDPFDRLIVAQAQILDVPIVTADPRIRQYDVATVDV